MWYPLAPSVHVAATIDTSQSSYPAVICAYPAFTAPLRTWPVGWAGFFPATAGVTYHLMVADYLYLGGGNLVLQLQ